MTRLIIAALILAASVPVHAAERRYTVTDFDRIQVDGPFVVTVSTGKAPSATAEGSHTAIDRVSIDVQGRTLRVRPNRSAWGGYPGDDTGPLAIALTAHDLRGVSLTGSGTLTVDKAAAMRFDVAVSGSGGITLGQVEADNLVLGLLGSGRIVIGGKAETLRATIQGSGDLDAGALSVEDAEINSDTAGSIEVTVRETAKVTSTGPGDTHLAGSAACTVKALGAGRVVCGD